MKAYTFQATLNQNGTLKVPDDVIDQLGDVAEVRVVVEVPEDDDADWQRLTTEQFFRGYADSDSIYDDA